MEAQAVGIARGRVVFLTKNGYLGVTNNCQAGGSVYIVGGGNMPVILGKDIKLTGFGNVYHRVVGDCYLHGFMEGKNNASLTMDAGELQKL